MTGNGLMEKVMRTRVINGYLVARIIMETVQPPTPQRAGEAPCGSGTCLTSIGARIMETW